MTKLLLLAGILAPSALIAAGDRVWIDNQTGQPLIVLNAMALNMDKNDFYHNEMIFPHDTVPVGRTFHFALVNWYTFRDGEPTEVFTIGSLNWQSSCQFTVLYASSNFQSEIPICRGLTSSSLRLDGQTSDSIVDWTYTINNTPMLNKH